MNRPLLTYCKDAFSLECSVYEMDNLIQALRNKKEAFPRYPNKQYVELYIPHTIGFALGGIICLTLILSSNSSSFFGALLVLAASGAALYFAFKFLIYFIKFLVALFSTLPNAMRKYKYDYNRYTASLPAKNRIDYAITILEKKKKETRGLLGLLYSRDIISYKYRNILAVSAFCEYLETGRCDTLIGPYGAYNIFENAMGIQMINSKLDQILDNLRLIQQNQRMLHSAILEINNRISRLTQSIVETNGHLASISDSLDKQAECAEIIAYTTALTQKEVEYRNRLELGSHYYPH